MTHLSLLNFKWMKPMTMRPSRLGLRTDRGSGPAALVVFALGFAYASPGVASTAEGDRWWGHVAALAADSMEGRRTGTTGYRRAADYVIGEFERLGLEPGGEIGFRQPVEFVLRTNDPASSAIVLHGVNGAIALAPGVDAYFQMSCAQAESLTAEAVFVGYGLVAPDVGHDDLRALDLRGRIAVYLGGAPESLPEPARSFAQSVAERWSRLRRAGAVGWLAIPNPKGLHWESYRSRTGNALALADSMLDERRGQRFAATIDPAKAEPLFEGSGVTFASLLALADSGRILPRFPLAVRIESRARYTVERLRSDNVVGVLPGGGETSREAVVLSAHLDHLGVVPQEGDSILNGALDNAAGVATLIEAARALRGESRRRSIVFLAVAGEEQNLLGSRYFASRTPARAGTLVANLNVDMLLPIAPFDRITVYGLDESSLGTAAREVAGRQDLAVQPDPKPKLNRFIRSDQFSFIREGVPALAFHSGGAAGSPIESLRAEWMEHRYHAPGDDLHQPVDLDAAARFTRFYASLAATIADADRLPAWNPGSFFGRWEDARAGR
jgi:hypothetical protein